MPRIMPGLIPAGWAKAVATAKQSPKDVTTRIANLLERFISNSFFRKLRSCSFDQLHSPASADGRRNRSRVD
jgi:hypothetical protein